MLAKDKNFTNWIQHQFPKLCLGHQVLISDTYENIEKEIATSWRHGIANETSLENHEETPKMLSYKFD